jgi:hypothetical protein
MEISIYFLSQFIFVNKVYYYRKLHKLKVYRKIISQIRNNELKPVSKIYTVELFCSSYFLFVKVKSEMCNRISLDYDYVIDYANDCQS